jgi:hypothetical protein
VPLRCQGTRKRSPTKMSGSAFFVLENIHGLTPLATTCRYLADSVDRRRVPQGRQAVATRREPVVGLPTHGSKPRRGDRNARIDVSCRPCGTRGCRSSSMGSRPWLQPIAASRLFAQSLLRPSKSSGLEAWVWGIRARAVATDNQVVLYPKLVRRAVERRSTCQYVRQRS